MKREVWKWELSSAKRDVLKFCGERDIHSFTRSLARSNFPIKIKCERLLHNSSLKKKLSKDLPLALIKWNVRSRIRREFCARSRLRAAKILAGMNISNIFLNTQQMPSSPRSPVWLLKWINKWNKKKKNKTKKKSHSRLQWLSYPRQLLSCQSSSQVTRRLSWREVKWSNSQKYTEILRCFQIL